MMITIPWQVVVAAIAANAIVVVALLMQIRDRADREHQRFGQLDRATEADIERIIRLVRLGFETRKQLEENENEKD